MLRTVLALVVAVVPAGGYFAGPAHVGERVTYRITTTTGAGPQETPNVSELVITKTAARLYARLGQGTPSTSVVVTRGSDGKLTTVTPGPVTSLLDLVNFPGALAAMLSGSEHGQTSLQVRPMPAGSASPAPQATPSDVAVPTTVDLIDNGSNGTTLIADGNTARASQFSRGGGGHRGGSWQRGGSTGGGRSASSGHAPAIEVAVEATFDANGELVHETYRETFVTSTSAASQTVERTVTIDRV